MIIMMIKNVMMMLETLNTLSIRITRTRRSTFPARPITKVSCIIIIMRVIIIIKMMIIIIK